MRCFLLLIIWIAGLPIAFAQVENFEVSNFPSADSVAALYERHSLDNLPLLAYKLASPFSEDVDKLRAIYTWVSTNIENDYGFYASNKRKREQFNDDPARLKEWNDKFAPRVFRKLLKERKTVCTGYAYLIKELCYHAGLKSEIVDGYGRTSESNIGGEGFINHSWNAVRLNGKWYLCDATWSSGGINPKEGVFIKDYNDAYFLADPKLFAGNHYPQDTTWMLLEEKPSLGEFLNAPLIYKGAVKQGVVPITPATFNVTVEKGQPLSIKLRKVTGAEVGEAELEIARGSHSVTKKVDLIPAGENSVIFDHTFTRRANYVMHVKVEGEYVVTYEVEVER